MEEKTTTKLSISGIPFGTILAFAGDKPEEIAGWALCDGTQISKVDYPNLFSVIGTAWGGSGTPFFNLPDLRGMFLRGVSGDTDRDPEKEDRFSAQETSGNPGYKGNNVGSWQSDSVGRHKHGLSQYGVIGYAPNTDKVFSSGNGGHHLYETSENDGKESRPINTYVYYIIKVDD